MLNEYVIQVIESANLESGVEKIRSSLVGFCEKPQYASLKCPCLAKRTLFAHFVMLKSDILLCIKYRKHTIILAFVQFCAEARFCPKALMYNVVSPLTIMSRFSPFFRRLCPFPRLNPISHRPCLHVLYNESELKHPYTVHQRPMLCDQFM